MRVACNRCVKPYMHCGVDIRFLGQFSIDDNSTTKSFVETEYPSMHLNVCLDG